MRTAKLNKPSYQCSLRLTEVNSLCALISFLFFLPLSFFLVYTFSNPGTVGEQIKAGPRGLYKLNEAHGKMPAMKHRARFIK